MYHGIRALHPQTTKKNTNLMNATQATFVRKLAAWRIDIKLGKAGRESLIAAAAAHIDGDGGSTYAAGKQGDAGTGPSAPTPFGPRIDVWSSLRLCGHKHISRGHRAHTVLFSSTPTNSARRVPLTPSIRYACRQPQRPAIMQRLRAHMAPEAVRRHPPT